MLRVKGIDVFYGDLQALRNVSLAVDEKEIITIVGSNGAGKSTTLMTLSGILHPRAGEIYFQEKPIHHTPSSRIVEMGIVQIPEGRQLFPPSPSSRTLKWGPNFQEPRRCGKRRSGGFFNSFHACRREKVSWPGPSAEESSRCLPLEGD